MRQKHVASEYDFREDDAVFIVRRPKEAQVERFILPKVLNYPPVVFDRKGNVIAENCFRVCVPVDYGPDKKE